MTNKQNVKVPPPVVFFICLALAITLNWIKPIALLDQHKWILLPLGIFLTLVSGLIAILAYMAMRKNDTPIDFNRPVKTILIKGPFRFTRNPLYLSLLMLMTGISCVMNTAWFVPFIVVLFLYFNHIAQVEEKYLQEEFGLQYMEYKKSVRRWL